MPIKRIFYFSSQILEDEELLEYFKEFTEYRMKYLDSYLFTDNCFKELPDFTKSLFINNFNGKLQV